MTVSLRRDAASAVGDAAQAASAGWEGLKTLIRARLLVATLALPVSVLLRPEPNERAWWVMGAALVAVGICSAIFWLGVRLRHGLRFQTYLQVSVDLAMVTVLAALSGGRDSQFMLFYGLVVITGGLLGRVPGGLFAVAGACLGIVEMPALTVWLAGPHVVNTGTGGLPPPGMLIGFLTVVGVLAGILGARVRRAREDLEHTSRELDRLRLDQDAILKHLTTGVLTVDDQGRVAYLNPAAEQVLGLRALEARSQPLAAALPERLEPLREVVADSLAQRMPRARAEVLMRGADDRPLPVGVSTSLLTHEGGITGVVAVFQDLTEVREMERRARRNQTLAEVGALAAGIAHELRNGLNPISGSVECLQRELKLEGENAVLMDLIATECTRLNRFVTDLLNYSRERDLAPETLVLDDQLGELCEGIARDPRCPAGVQVRYEPGSWPAAVRADREQIRQVWLNLATNALESMKDGGVLRVRWVDAGAGAITIEFADQGHGIASQDLPRVGQPFFTTKEGGTGLGVAIAQRIVERHGGTLVFVSAPGQGTTARVTLPAAAASVPIAA